MSGAAFDFTLNIPTLFSGVGFVFMLGRKYSQIADLERRLEQVERAWADHVKILIGDGK